jgi:hypothetical protein
VPSGIDDAQLSRRISESRIGIGTRREFIVAAFDTASLTSYLHSEEHQLREGIESAIDTTQAAQ